MATPGMQPAESPAATSSRLDIFLGSAKKLSDLGIALPVLLYTCGFVVLGCYSEANSLGLQVFPAIQFFSAGAGFLIIVAFMVLLVMALRLLLNNVFTRLNSGSKLSRIVKKIIPWSVLGSIATYYIADRLHHEKLSTVAMFAVLLSLFFSAEGWVQSITRYYLYLAGPALGVAFLVWYAFSAYPQIPASFGGGKPRHAHVQVDMKAISGDLSQQLMRAGQAPSGGLGNIEADVYLITDNSILMKVPRVDMADSNGSAPRKTVQPAIVLQLRRSDVSAIFWESRH
jgi:hypothetical protein